ncbi:class I SAM-dependent methyltransferase [Rhodopseudomonas palustris]|uniref:Methyltransferase domain-containing protein n=1 Tax=Rhodopseudomonas palustris TaxID=1076 RepID=A0A418UZE2_RHOPL|nr:methyltransferase domain-containing protein [Rhodopseudomonas palustris]RJF68732.1 methyltransferase domain-containing protein [Rhodopseudomonas palustris]
MKKILNVGSGSGPAQRLSPLIEGDRWEEVRFDIDPEVKPHVQGSISDLSSFFGENSFDGVWSSHVLEHLYAHEVFPALSHFHHILRPTGFAIILCPDLTAVAKFIVEKGMTTVAYNSPAGPIRPLDMLYGHSRAIENGRLAMAHRTGFTAQRLGNLLRMAGFDKILVRAAHFELRALALMPEADSEAISKELAPLKFDFEATGSSAGRELEDSATGRA